jgi:alanine dehydrogenase
MNIGILKEIKKHEYRVGATPSCVSTYCSKGHKVYVEKGAGVNAGFEDSEYKSAGAVIVSDKRKICDSCDMIIKVKEPLPTEYNLFHEGQILYTYLHLAAAKDLALAMLKRKIKGVAYETIQTTSGLLPCLKPMSEIAGRLSIQEGAKYLEKPFGGRGILLGGVPGVKRGNVVILGGGTAGLNACKIAVGIGANVTILDIDSNKLSYLDDIFGSNITTLYSNESNIESVLSDADLVIGAVLITGVQTPRLIRKHHLKKMKKGAVIVDIAVDQGGCTETTKPTTHDDPVYTVDGVVHYCVANMPGAVALSSTIALTSTTLRYGLLIAEQGLEKACRMNHDIKQGVNVYNGHCVYKNVAKSLDFDFTELDSVLED